MSEKQQKQFFDYIGGGVFGAMWVVEWSPSQGAFHIEQLRDAVKTNLELFVMGERLDYQPLAVLHTREEADEICDGLMARRNAKEAA